MNNTIKAQDFDPDIHVLISGGRNYDIQRVDIGPPDKIDKLTFVLPEGHQRPNSKTFFSFYAESKIEVCLQTKSQERHLWLMFNLWFQDEWEIWEQRDYDEVQLLIDRGLLWIEFDEEDGPTVSLTDKGRDFMSNLLSVGRGLIDTELVQEVEAA
ncbi:MAG: hypothetical protein ACFB2W_00595 [Leptolyngbyaceae cyanobacterium]